MDISQILTLNYKGQEWHLTGENYEGLDWLSKTTKPTLQELEDQWPEVELKVSKLAADKIATKQAVLDRLGLTIDEVKLLLG
jgi:hypothetical protein